MNKVIASGGSSMEYHQSVQYNNPNASSQPDYPQYNSNFRAQSDYPQYNSNLRAQSDYPQYNSNARDQPDYPQYNSNARDQPDYPQYNSNARDLPDYPQYNSNARDQPDYPQNNPNADFQAGYPQYNTNAHLQSGYGQYNSSQGPYTVAAYPPSYEQAASGPPPPSVPNYDHMSVVDDSESGTGVNDTTMTFSEKSIRHAFVRKVYAILMVQLIITIAIICTFIYWETLRSWAWEHSWLVYATLPATFVLLICLSCCSNIRRKAPCNFIFLLLFTVLEGVLLGSVAIIYTAESVMWAVGITAFISLSLTIFSFQTKIDFTMKSGILFVFLMALLSFGLMCAILRSYWANIAYATLGALLFSAYLVVDTQLMLGGKHRYSLSPEEYVFAALNLYIDIVSIFLFILAIFQR